MTTPPTRISIRVDYQTAYKGGIRQWSNRFFLSSSVAMTGSVFDTLSDWLTNIMVSGITARTTIVGTVGYDAGSDVPTNSKTYSLSGSNTVTGGETLATLEVAALWRFATDARTSKNHPIYLFKYVHDQILGTSSDREAMVSGRRTTQESLAGDLVTGDTVGGTLYQLCGPFGAVALSSSVGQFFTHRDFPT